jgi:hypothetical protein
LSLPVLFEAYDGRLLAAGFKLGPRSRLEQELPVLNLSARALLLLLVHRAVARQNHGRLPKMLSFRQGPARLVVDLM